MPQRRSMNKSSKRIAWWEALILVFLTIYPLRHIYWGLDLWDTGYNYANFKYAGMEHMDPMWLFSTYLANVFGSMLTKLPGAGTLMGMNFYTGLLVSGLALIGYFFCTRKIGMPKWIALLGEFIAISLCWCPTALLYNYLTYVLFLVSVVCLYLGLTKNKKAYFIVAGILLGLNVLTRFSNLPEAAMIVAVWAYGVVEYFDVKRAKENETQTAETEGVTAKTFVAITWKRTLWCLVGFLSALVVAFGYLHIRYGLDAYLAGIQRLFAMTDTATDYKATSMVMGMVHIYVENLYWVIRIGAIAVGGMVVYGLCEWGKGKIEKPCIAKALTEQETKQTTVACAWAKAFEICSKLLMVALAILMVVWLYYRNFCSTLYFSYDSMLRPGVLFLMLTMAIGVLRIFSKVASKEEKLLSGMLILILVLTSLGSNNEVYPSLNNLFLAAPYTLWESWKFVKNVKVLHLPIKIKETQIALHMYPLKAILLGFMFICFVQFGAFGATFVFAEATGVQDISARVENNEVLQGIQMPADKAQWMTELSAFVTEQNLQGQEVILYGEIPALSYYLQMPAAFNPWPDLRSYNKVVMEEELHQLKADGETPVIILEVKTNLKAEAEDNTTDLKWQILKTFMEEMAYEETFRNEKFVVYQS